MGHDGVSPAFQSLGGAVACARDSTMRESPKQGTIINRGAVVDYRGPLGVGRGRGRAFIPPAGTFVTPPEGLV